MGNRIVRLAAVAAAVALALGATMASGQHYPEGEMPESGTSHPAQGGGGGSSKKALFAVLRGRNELDPVTLKRGAGDPDGRGAANLTIDGTTVCFGITVTNLDQPVASHIHKAGKKKNGPIVVPLTQPSTGDPGASGGCTEADSADLARDIQRHPRRYYVNVHTMAFPAGAVRGQLFGKKR